MSTLKHENMFKLTQNSIFQKYLCAYAILKHCVSSFYARRFQKCKKAVKLDCLFCAFGICAHKSCL